MKIAYIGPTGVFGGVRAGRVSDRGDRGMTEQIHKCKEHQQRDWPPLDYDYEAIDKIMYYEIEQRWIATTAGQYATFIDYCPFCGVKLPIV